MDQNELLRTATSRISAQPSLNSLQTNDLLTALGMEMQGQTKNVAAFAEIDTISEDELVRSPELVDLGRNILRRWNRTLHGFACTPDSEDQDLRDKIFKALSGAEGGAALLAGVLVSAFGLNFVTATLIATLVMRLFVDAAGDEICGWWGEHLDDVPE